MKQLYALLLAVSQLFIASVGRAQTGAVLDLDGVNDNVIIPSPIFTAYTIEVRVRFNATAANQNIIVFTSGNALSSYSHQIKTDASGRFEHYLYDGFMESIIGSTIAVPGTWYTVSITANNNGWMRLYVNGKEEGVAKSIGNVWNGGNQFQLGSATDEDGFNGTARVNRLNGQFDEVRIWNRVLTESEIKANVTTSLNSAQSGLLRLYNFNEGIGNGDNTGIIGISDASGNGSNGILNGFTLNGTSSNFVPFSGIMPLPVKLKYFSAISRNSGTLLEWRTALETNSRQFVIERSADGRNFSAIAQLNAAGNSSQLTQYQYFDTDPVVGINYYRLKMVDLDESFEYSKVQMVKMVHRQNNSDVFVNRTGTVVKFTIKPTYSGKGILKIYSNTGHLLVQRPLTLKEGNVHQESITDQFDSHIYYYQLLGANEVLANGKF